LDNHFIVCGLGRLGQHCVGTLKELGGTVVGIEREPPSHWELQGLSGLLDLVLTGDCRLVEPD
jgi:phosphoglycerate dehydrogenase-like enzyme